MAEVPRSLNIHVPWATVAELLGLPLKGVALPATTACPLCGGSRLRIDQDSTTGGAWHYCRDCKSCGDMITLAGAVWKTDIQGTLERLQRRGIDLPETHLESPTVASYADLQRQQIKIQELWALAQVQICSQKSQAITNLQHKYHLQLRADKERWADGPAKLFGALTVNQVERALCSPGSLNPYGRMKANSAFGGRSWSEVLAMPFYDMPHRICAFAFMGRQGDPEKDNVFKVVNPYGQVRRREAGLGCLTSVEMAHDPDTVIATDDWLLAGRVQIRHFRTSYTPIPLVVWADNGKVKTRKAWKALANKKIVFWRFHIDARVIMQAVHTDGYISVLGPKKNTDDKGVGHFLRDNARSDLAKKIIKSARPWRKALAHWDSCQRRETMRRLFNDLEEAGEDVSYVFRQIAKKSKTVIESTCRRTVQIGRRTIIERKDGWQVESANGSKSLLMDAALRVTHAISDIRSGELFYRGYVQYHEHRVHFVEPAKTLESKVLPWIRNLISQKKLGLLQANTTACNQQNLYDVAVAFETPVFVDEEVADHVQELRDAGHIEDPI